MVYEAIDIPTGTRVAVKKTKKEGRFQSREVLCLNKLAGCENIVKLLNVIYVEGENNMVCQEMVLEYCETSLEEVI